MRPDPEDRTGLPVAFGRVNITCIIRLSELGLKAAVQASWMTRGAMPDEPARLRRPVDALRTARPGPAVSIGRCAGCRSTSTPSGRTPPRRTTHGASAVSAEVARTASPASRIVPAATAASPGPRSTQCGAARLPVPERARSARPQRLADREPDAVAAAGTSARTRSPSASRSTSGRVAVQADVQPLAVEAELHAASAPAAAGRSGASRRRRPRISSVPAPSHSK